MTEGQRENYAFLHRRTKMSSSRDWNSNKLTPELICDGPKSVKVNPNGVQLVLDLMIKAELLKKPYPKPENVIDHSYRQEISGR
jgi:hypothetical protein